MLYSDCEQKYTPSSNQHKLPHLTNADYLTSAAMSLSPKYNTAFSVTSLLNPALEETYKISSQFHHHHHHHHNQQHDLATSNFLNSYSNRNNTNNSTTTNNNASSSSSSVSSTSSSIINSSTKHPSPSNSAHSGTHPSLYQNSPTSQLEPEFSRFTSAIQPALGSLCSSGSNSSSSAASTTTPAVPPGSGFNPAGLANPYFNYSNNQFSSFHHSGNNIGHQSSAHHQYNAYNQAYTNGNIGQNFAESDGYPNTQLQYSSGGPQAWYPNPNDPRFSSKLVI